VDRNSRENVAVMADRQTGKVQRLGIDSSLTKEVFRNRRSALQRAGKYRLLKKLRRKQRRRMTYENHCVSKTVVEYAATHRRAVAVERLEGVRSKGSKIRRYAEKNQWAFAQLLTFLSYKCALRGVPLLEVDPAYTSQACSRCGSLHAPHGKQFTCRTCGHNDHRDANAAFNIAARGVERIGERGGTLRVVSSGRIGAPQAETMAVLA
jgi:putative transposase